MSSRGWTICCIVLGVGSSAVGQSPNHESGLVSNRYSGLTRTQAASKDPFPEGRFVLESDDTVVFVGGANIVESQRHGQLEALLSLAFPQHVRFRNLAWEGDTVFEQPRDLNFGTWSEQLELVRATVAIVQFGQLEALVASPTNHALAADDEVARFIEAYEHLLDQFVRRTHRIVLVSPAPFESPRSDLMPDLTRHNALLERFVAATEKLARRRDFLFVDLYHTLQARQLPMPLTDDGLHLTPAGQTFTADAIANALHLSPHSADAIIELRSAIRHKNRLWFDYWRPRNWTFLWGDRTTQPFSKDWRAGESRLFPAEMNRYQPLIKSAEQEIAQQVLRVAGH